MFGIEYFFKTITISANCGILNKTSSNICVKTIMCKTKLVQICMSYEVASVLVQLHSDSQRNPYYDQVSDPHLSFSEAWSGLRKLLSAWNMNIQHN